MTVRRALSSALIAAVMAASGAGTYVLLLRAHATGAVAAVTRRPTDPGATTSTVSLPGTIVLAQSGSLYAFTGGRFSRLTAEDGWMQPSAAPGGDLYAVRRGAASSDVYELAPSGAVVRQLTRNAAPARDGDLSADHWAFYPRASADGRSFFVSYDSPKAGYEVDFAVWSFPASGARPPHRWTAHESYTGGDVEGVPLASGALLYTKYAFDGDHLASRIWMQAAPLGAGSPLTDAADACAQPAVSPSGDALAMICRRGTQRVDLLVAPFDGTKLGAPRVLVSGMPARPTWAPDGSGIAYLAPAAGGGPFQLWWLTLDGAPTQVTTGLAFDATSSPAWLAARAVRDRAPADFGRVARSP